VPEKQSTFVLYGLGCIAANLALTFSLTQGDHYAYAEWTRHLQQNGFADFPGNYPPLYVEWLWVVGRILGVLGLPAKASMVHKFLMLWPIYAAHLLLVRLVWNELKNSQVAPPTASAILALCAFNPALLAGGPAWGQVDLLPAMLMAAGFYLYGREKGYRASPLLWTLGLLTKFQMIAFAPVLGALLLRDLRRYVPGMLLSAIALLLVLLPFALAGGLGAALTNAYLSTISLYQYATMNAANLWLLLTGNMAPDNYNLFSNAPPPSPGPQLLLSPKGMGITLFSLYCVVIFIASLRIQSRSTLWKYALFCSLGFFVLLPGMHERYLLPAVVMALFWAATTPGALPWAAVITVVSFLNIELVHPLGGDWVWWLLAILITGSFLLLNLGTVLPVRWAAFVTQPASFSLPHWLPEATLAAVLILSLLYLSVHAASDTFQPASNERLLSSLPQVSAIQAIKHPQIDRSVDGNPLSVSNVTYAYGIGTHAPSQLTYDLPPEATAFHFKVGVDDEAYPGKVMFVVLVDGKERWRSRIVRGGQRARAGHVRLTNARQITLVTDPLDRDFHDHADWLNPVIRMQ